jgi:hypothetical protein
MSFPSDTERFYVVGNYATNAGILTQVNVGVVIGPDENATLVNNAHSNYTNTNRVFLCSMVNWGHYGGGSQSPVIIGVSGMGATESARQILHVSPGRVNYTYYIDSAGLDVQLDLWNDTTSTSEDTATLSGAGGREWNGGLLTRTGSDSDEYHLIISLAKMTGAPTDGVLWGLHLIENETTT